MNTPVLTDTRVKVRAYLTDEIFGHDHWCATQFLSPPYSKPALLLIFDTDEERDAVVVLPNHQHEFSIPIEWERVQMSSNVAETWRTRVTRLRCRVGTCEESVEVANG